MAERVGVLVKQLDRGNHISTGGDVVYVAAPNGSIRVF
jgi:hypothetical protein